MRAELRTKLEVDHLVEWLQEFEQRVQGLRGGGTLYRSAALAARVRYSWYQAAAAGRPAICLTELRFAEPSIGEGILRALARRFFHGQHELVAEFIVMEHPSDVTMCRWLASSAFLPMRAPGEIAQSWYLGREDLHVMSEDHLTMSSRTLPACY